MTALVPDKASLDGLKSKWIEQWESAGVYRFGIAELIFEEGGQADVEVLLATAE